MFTSARRIYLDYAASVPVSRAALRAFTEGVKLGGNPSSSHTEGRQAKDLLEDARLRIARLAGTKADAVIFTSGATEANALGIEGHIRALIEKGGNPKGMHVLYLPSAHASVIGAVQAVAALGVSVEPIVRDVTQREAQIRKETVLVILDLVCGETGNLYPVRTVRRTLDRVRPNGPRITLMVDASQAPRVESFELQHLGADLVSLDAQKVGGVRGIGALIAPQHIPLQALMYGGGQERGLRPGTESPALASAFATALEACEQKREAFVASATEVRLMLLSSLSGIANMEVNEGKGQVPHILNLSFIGRDTDYLLALLDEAGFAVSTKSACESDEEGSRAVRFMTGENARAASTLRISWGPETREKDLKRFASALTTAVRFLDENAIY